MNNSVTERWIELAGLRLHLLEAGVGREPLVMLHGGGIDAAHLSWRHSLAPLSEHFHVIAPDWPGYGRGGSASDPLPENTIQAYIHFLDRLLEKLELPQVNLGGLSMGGGISLGYALQHPDHVQRLVLIGSYGLQPTAPSHFLSYLFVQVPAITVWTYALMRRSKSLVRQSLLSIVHDPAALGDDLVEEVYQLIQQPDCWRPFYALQKDELLPGRVRTCYLKRMGELKMPVLLVHGLHDSLVPVEYARQAAHLCPQAMLEIIEKAGHWTQIGDPAVFHKVLIEFLTSDR